MKKLMVLGLGIVLVAVTAGSVSASTETTVRNANCNVSIESKQETLKQYVQEEKITQEKADEIIKQLENCDGTSAARIGQKSGVRFGNGNGQGKGLRNGSGGNCQMRK